MKDYVDARREFWEGAFLHCTAHSQSWAAKWADDAMNEWDLRYKCGSNGTCVRRDEAFGTYNASQAGVTRDQKFGTYNATEAGAT